MICITFLCFLLCIVFFVLHFQRSCGSSLSFAFNFSPQMLSTHCAIATPYGDMNLTAHRLRYWLGAWRQELITWTNVDLSSKLFRSIHLIIISHGIVHRLYAEHEFGDYTLKSISTYTCIRGHRVNCLVWCNVGRIKQKDAGDTGTLYYVVMYRCLFAFRSRLHRLSHRCLDFSCWIRFSDWGVLSD